MSFHDELSRKVYELIQIAWGGFAYDEDDEELRHGGDVPFGDVFPIPQRDPADVWEAFEYYFNTADPENADDINGKLVRAGQELYEAQTMYFAGINDRLGAWQGEAANAFKRHVTAVWWSATVHQSVLEQVGALYGGYVDLIAKARQDAIAIADTTIDALKDFWRSREAAERQANLVAAGVVVGIIATMATAGIAAPAAAAATSTVAAAEIASTVIIESAVIKSAADAANGLMQVNEILRIKGADPDEIITDLLEQLHRARSDVKDQGLAIAEGFRKAMEVLSEPTIVPELPAAAYAPFNPEEFRVVSSVMPDQIAAAASHEPLLAPDPTP